MKGLIPKMKLHLRNNSPTILTCIGAIGVVGTSVLAVRATPKALKLLEKATEEKGEDLTKMEVVQTVGAAYIPSIVIGASTIACIFGANVLNKRKQASLASAYALLSSYHKEYRNKLKELYGEEADKEIRDAIVRENCEFHQIGVDTPDQKLVFYDEISGRSIRCYERKIMDAEYHLNRNFTMRGYTSLNEFYEFLGLPKTDYGEELGWSMSDGYCWIDFQHRKVTKDDGSICYVIDMIFPPDNEYMREWEW